MANNNGWSVIDGDLPDGVKLDPITGKISGKPTEYGEFKATIKIVNPCGDDEREITIIVCTEPKITSENEISFLMGEEDSFQLTSSGLPGVWSIVDTGGDFDEDFEDDFLIGGILPDGLTLDPQTGVISGTATEYGEFVLTVKFKNICGEDTQEITIIVGCSEPEITSENEIKFVKGEEDSFQLTSSGLPGVWSIVDTGGDFDKSFDESFHISGVLPNGLTLDSETGIISGTPTEHGDFPVMVKVENDCGGESTQKITITVENKIYLLSFNVKDNFDDPVLDADIVCKDDSNNTLTIKNNGDGTYTADVIDGEYTYSVSKDGYYVKTGSVIVYGENVNEEVILKSSIHTLTFTVSDNTNPVLDAIVDCFDNENNPVAVTNNGNGTYSALVPDGEYAYTISKTGFQTVNGSVIVDGDDENVSVGLLPPPEYIIHLVDSSDGTFIIPTRGYGNSSQNVPYNWIIEGSLDGENYTFIQNANGSSSSNGGIDISPNIPSGLKSTDMYLRIRSTDPNSPYAWARAFGFDFTTSGAGVSTNRSKVKKADISSCQKGFRLNGTTSLGHNFLYGIWNGCSSLITTIIPDTSGWNVSNIGDGFLWGTWQGCTSLVTAVVPDTSGWNVTSIGNQFLNQTWYDCTSLVTAVVPDTSGWNISGSIGYYFLGNTWYGCTSLVTAVVPDTSGWNVTNTSYCFLSSTWQGCTSLVTAVVPDTSGWNVTSTVDFFLPNTWYGCTSLVTAVIPDTSGWNVSSIGDSFLQSTWQGCTSLVTAVVPDTSGWNVTNIGNDFLYRTWLICTSLVTAAVPDTSGWNVSSIGNYFLFSTWGTCTSLVTAAVPDTSGWNVSSIGNYFLSYTWSNCTSLVTAAVPDTSGWNVSSIGNYFLQDTFNGSFSTSGTRVLTIPDNVSKPVYTGSIKALHTNSAGINNSRIDEIYVPCELVSAFRSSSSWSNIDPNSKFIECVNFPLHEWVVQNVDNANCLFVGEEDNCIYTIEGQGGLNSTYKKYSFSNGIFDLVETRYGLTMPYQSFPFFVGGLYVQKMTGSAQPFQIYNYHTNSDFSPTSGGYYIQHLWHDGVLYCFSFSGNTVRSCDIIRIDNTRVSATWDKYSPVQTAAINTNPTNALFINGYVYLKTSQTIMKLQIDPVIANRINIIDVFTGLDGTGTTTGYVIDRIVYFDGCIWYVSGNGLNSFNVETQEVNQYPDGTINFGGTGKVFLSNGELYVTNRDVSENFLYRFNYTSKTYTRVTSPLIRNYRIDSVIGNYAIAFHTQPQYGTTYNQGIMAAYRFK